MNQLSSAVKFPSKINRRFSLAFAGFIGIVLVVGGISLALTTRIHRTNHTVDQENAHIRTVGSIYSVLNEIIAEFQRMEAIGQFDRIEHLLLLHKQVEERLGTFRTLHQGKENIPDQQESALLSDLENLVKDLRTFTNRIFAAPIRSRLLYPKDVNWLNLVSHEATAKTDGIMNFHRTRITRLLQDSDRSLQAIVVLYAAFVFASGSLLTLTSIGFRRGIVAPLQKLSMAATGIADGRLEERVPVRSRNEIGQLSHAFNVMAERLQVREKELRVTYEQLEQRVNVTQALYQIGSEIASLHQLDRILPSIVQKARELLRTEAAAISTLTLGQDELVVRATSGPPQAFIADNPRARCSVVGGQVMESHNRACPAMQPDYHRVHLAVPLLRGANQIGVICVACMETREFKAADEQLLTALATQVVIAIENARLYEEARSLATLAERDRLARELHDGLAQALALLHLKLDRAREQAATGDLPQWGDALRGMTAIADRAYEDLRQSIFGLRTKVPRELGLVPSLIKYIYEFSAQSEIRVELDVAEGRPIHLSPVSEIQLIRIVQEALANVRKHTGAGRALVRLRRQDSWIRVTIEDGGRGFDPSIVASGEPRAFGLQTMRERAEAVGGSLEIDTAPGRGTRIVATLPEGA